MLIGLVLLAACGSVGDGGILGSPNSSTASSVTGVVADVDTKAQRIDLNVFRVNNTLPSASQSTGLVYTGSVYYDQNTRVVYQNQNYNQTDVTRWAIPARRLQAGDGLSVVGANNNGRYIAQTITVTTNVRVRE